jgi:DNA-binding Lrp family transcriptional regulator
VLRLVTGHPGITVREIGERLGVDATGLYRVVKRLTDDGRVRKDGTRLHPIEPATTSAPAPGRAAASASQTADDEAQSADAAATAEPESSAAATETAPSADT